LFVLAQRRFWCYEVCDAFRRGLVAKYVDQGFEQVET